jgi:type I restriction enzyme S subunit
MKEGWGKYNLMDICNVTTGKHDANHAEVNGKYRFYTCSSQYLYCNTKRYEGECIILPGNGVNVGESYYFNGEFDAYQRTYVIDKIDKRIIPMFLYYHLQNNWKSEGVAKQYGSATNYIKIGNFKDYIVKTPQSLSEQQSIVDYLDSAFAKIDAMKANAEKALNEAKALFQASLKEMLEPKEGIKWGTIGDLFETYSGGTPTKSNKEYYEGGSIPWLRSGEVCKKEITETEMYITEKGLKESSAKYYPENTVVVAMYGATAAQVGILRIKSTSNQAVCGILPHKDFMSEFVYYWFSSIEDKLAAQAQGGAQPNISQQKIKKVEIPMFSKSEQQSIVATLDSLKSKVDRLQANYDKISQECDALKQAILRQVFE